LNGALRATRRKRFSDFGSSVAGWARHFVPSACTMRLCKSETLKAALAFVKVAFGTIAPMAKELRCSVHPDSELVCPRCMGARGGKRTIRKHKAKLSKWGKQGGRPTSKRKR
jgi:hypothetical protein